MKQKLDALTFAKIADHTLLAPATTKQELADFISEAAKNGIARVCVSPSLLPVAKQGLEIVTVVGFPSGAHHAEVKAFEAARAVADGADEIDMVVNPALIWQGDYEALTAEVALVKAASAGKPLKVILETATLSPEQTSLASRAAIAGGADLIKTSTGFSSAGGASVAAVAIMAEAAEAAEAAHHVGVKASGGVRTAADAEAMWQAGATRFGVSATLAILAELRGEGEGEGASTKATAAY